ncbi:DJ-1/PfpI family protein [Paenibacillus lautus]|uniref:DJ-1/PfpI family protein n=1 Tax=Paenibacillus lautus TaxID=1401 RepID=UPI0039878A5B
MRHVQIVLFDGFDLLDAIAPYEVFCAAALYAEHELRVELVTAEGSRAVASGVNGLTIEASGKLNPECAGIILVPGASGEVDGDGPDSIPAILGRAMNTELTGMIGQALDQKDIIVATVCGGSLLLAMSGLLEGRSAVTHHLGMGLLGATGAVPIKARVVDDGSLVTGGGVTSGLDVALYLVERELGPRIAHAVEQLFEYERRGTVWKGIGLAPSIQKALPDDNEPTAATNHGVLTNAASGHQLTQASMFEGDWDTVIATPVGKMEVRLSISAKNDMIEGTATQGDETIQFRSPVLQGSKLVWSLPVVKPMRLNLKFEVTADGDYMTGTAKAGMLPASKLTGTRVS